MASSAIELLLRQKETIYWLRAATLYVDETFIRPALSRVVILQRKAPGRTDDMVQMLEDIAAEGWRR